MIWSFTRTIGYSTTAPLGEMCIRDRSSPTASRAGDLQFGGGFVFGNSDYNFNRVSLNGGAFYITFDKRSHWGYEGCLLYTSNAARTGSTLRQSPPCSPPATAPPRAPPRPPPASSSSPLTTPPTTTLNLQRCHPESPRDYFAETVRLYVAERTRKPSVAVTVTV